MAGLARSELAGFLGLSFRQNSSHISMLRHEFGMNFAQGIHGIAIYSSNYHSYEVHNFGILGNR